MNKDIEIKITLEDAEALTNILHFELDKIKRERRHAKSRGYDYDFMIESEMDDLLIKVIQAKDAAMQKTMSEKEIYDHNRKHYQQRDYIEHGNY